MLFAPVVVPVNAEVEFRGNRHFVPAPDCVHRRGALARLPLPLKGGGCIPGKPAASSQRPTASTAEALWRAWIQNGDVAARDRLVLSYAPMVKYLACRKVRELPAHCELDDLVSCGLLA